MLRVLLNGENYVAQPTPGTWSELLVAIDRDLERRGCVITAIRVDGIDQPGFRETAHLARPLHGDAFVEVDASTPASLLEDGLREAARSVRALQEASWPGALFIIGFAALFVWQIGNFFRFNRPIRYEADAPPENLLPRA